VPLLSFSHMRLDAWIIPYKNRYNLTPLET
jgi:hypothetical protein